MATPSNSAPANATPSGGAQSTSTGEPPTQTPRAPQGAMRWLVPTLALVAAVIVGLFGGILIGQNTATANPTVGARGGFPNGIGATNRPGGGFGAGGLGGVTAGTIVSVSGDTIVVKNRQGTQVTVTTTDSTKVTEAKPGVVSDLKAGDTITAIGQPDGSGNVTATTIAEGTGGFGGFGGQRNGGGAGSGGNN